MTPAVLKECRAQPECYEKFAELQRDVAVLHVNVEHIRDDLKEIKSAVVKDRKTLSTVKKVLLALLLAGGSGAGLVEVIKSLV